MARSWFINGEALVRVKGAPGGALAKTTTGKEGNPGDFLNLPGLWDLGLSVDPIVVTPRFVDQDIKCDDFGPDIPADVMTLVAEVSIRMRLIHFDRNVLGQCLIESMAATGQGAFVEGVVGPTGTPMGAGVPLLTHGNRWISLNILNGASSLVSGPGTANAFRFPSAKLFGQPFEFPLGTAVSVVLLSWRAIPYAPILNSAGTNPVEPTSANKVLWDFNIDTQ